MSKYKTLRYCLLTAGIKLNDTRHAQAVMKELGITYKHAVPQSISDSWEFWGCENVPEDLPESIEVTSWNPMDRIGWGLNKETAEMLRDLYKD